MKLDAVIFDVYGTLLELERIDSASTLEAAWQALHEECLPGPVPRSYAAWRAACEREIEAEHTLARALGIAHPEISWNDVVTRTLPEISLLAPLRRDGFLARLAGIPRRLRLGPGWSEILSRLHRARIPLGIASNAQPYTLAELTEALRPFGLDLGLFEPDLRFWSFEHGFSKPNPHVFRILSARLRLRGLDPARTLMVGDREDNDVVPARAFGWQTWHWAPACGRAGDALQEWLRSPG